LPVGGSATLVVRAGRATLTSSRTASD
jgi:hypothetical protein